MAGQKIGINLGFLLGLGFSNFGPGFSYLWVMVGFSGFSLDIVQDWFSGCTGH